MKVITEPKVSEVVGFECDCGWKGKPEETKVDKQWPRPALVYCPKCNTLLFYGEE